MRANTMQSPKLHLSKYDKSRSNVVFTSYLLRFCYGGKSVFSSSVVRLYNEKSNTWLLVNKEFVLLVFNLISHSFATLTREKSS